MELLKTYGGKTYDFRLRETQTYEIIEDVAKLKSEIGVLYLNHVNRESFCENLKEHNLKFERLFLAKPQCLSDRANPLAKREKITLQDLEPYPRLSYEQGDHNAFYFSEEILSTLESRKDIPGL